MQFWEKYGLMRKLRLSELNRPNLETYQAAVKFPVVVVLDNIRSGLNIGSFFRTTEAFLFESIYLTGICATPPHKEIEKTAIGSTDSVHWKYYEKVTDCIIQLKADGYTIIGVEQTDNSQSLVSFRPPVPQEKLALIFGNEVKGVSNDVLPLLNEAIEIPQHGTKHSLNVSVCGGIVLWKIYEAYSKVATTAS